MRTVRCSSRLPGGGVAAFGLQGVYPSMYRSRHPHCEQNDWQTGVKTSPSQTSFAGGKYAKFVKNSSWKN